MGAEISKFYRFTDGTLRKRLRLGHDRLDVLGRDIAMRGYVLQNLIARGLIVESPGRRDAPENEQEQAQEAAGELETTLESIDPERAPQGPFEKKKRGRPRK